MLTTIPISQTVEMPDCNYQVLREDVGGDPVRYARIGDKVYHRWRCEGGQAELFCMTVHSCTVDDGQGIDPTYIVDELGCAQDQYLLSNLEYLNDVEAGQASHVFKYADKPSLFFSCQIRLSLRPQDGGRCERQSERCPTLLRGKRAAGAAPLERGSQPLKSAQKAVANVDVPAVPIDVLEIHSAEEPEPPPALVEEPWWMDGSPFRPHTTTQQQVCVTPLGAGFLAAAVAGLLCAASAALFVACVERRKRRDTQKAQDDPASSHEAFRVKIWSSE